MSERVNISWEPVDPVSDEQARRYLEELLTMRSQAAAGQQPGLRAANIAATAFSELARGVLDWVSTSLALRVPPAEFSQQSLNETRLQVARCLELGLPVMQPEACSVLAQALKGLNAGYADMFVRRAIGRRRAMPDLSAEAEFRILRWERWQCGLGRTLQAARAEAAHALGCGPDTIKNWRAPIEKIYGTAMVRRELDLAGKVGRAEKKGLSPKELRPRESDDDQRLWEAWANVPRDLTLLVEMRQGTIAKRQRRSAKGT